MTRKCPLNISFSFSSFFQGHSTIIHFVTFLFIYFLLSSFEFFSQVCVCVCVKVRKGSCRVQTEKAERKMNQTGGALYKLFRQPTEKITHKFEESKMRIISK